MPEFKLNWLPDDDAEKRLKNIVLKLADDEDCNSEAEMSPPKTTGDVNMSMSEEARHEARPPTQRSETSTQCREQVLNFLGELPKMPAHYCRAHTQKLFLEPRWTSVKQLHGEYLACVRD